MIYTDIFGDQIELTSERWFHIIREHPEVSEYNYLFTEVLGDPDYVKKSNRDDDVLLYYRYTEKRSDCMGKEIRLVYDEEGDVLNISLGEPQNATSREIDDDIFIRVDTVNDEIVGFSILNFRKWFKDARDIKTLPLQAELAFVSQFNVKQP